MRGKTVVITGGTSGIGEIAAVDSRMGARIVLVTRDKFRGEATLARLHDIALASPIRYILLISHASLR